MAPGSKFTANFHYPTANLKFTAEIGEIGSKFTDGVNVIIGHTRRLQRDVVYLG
jgi:hypothetical protein